MSDFSEFRGIFYILIGNTMDGSNLFWNMHLWIDPQGLDLCAVVYSHSYNADLNDPVGGHFDSCCLKVEEGKRAGKVQVHFRYSGSYRSFPDRKPFYLKI